MEVTRPCRQCDTPVEVDERGFSYCKPCRRWDADECLVCRTRDGFPREFAAPPAIAERSTLLRNVTGAERVRELERIGAKARIYCARHYHDAYFTHADGAPTSRCVLCDTVWDRTEVAVHRL